MLPTTIFGSPKTELHHIRDTAMELAEGKLVAFPTETVYGLGGNALLDDAVAGIYEAKGRPQFNPLIVHVASLEDAARYAEFNDVAKKLASAFWPGPFTMVLPRRKDCVLSLLVSAGLDTVALRVPAHSMAQTLLHESGVPIAAPSANKSGRVSPTEAAHVQSELGDKVSAILDGGPCHVGIESTVVDVSEDIPVLLRPGSILKSDIEKLVGEVRMPGKGGALKSPGMLERHYSPTKPLRLEAKSVQSNEALLAFGAPLAGAHVTENLSLNGDMREAAANLFRMLRLLDESDADAIAVMPIANEGLGEAINDRLKRAATR